MPHAPLPPIFHNPINEGYLGGLYHDADELSDSESEKDGKDDEKAVKVKAGMKPDIKNLYEGLPKCGCCVNWVDKIPRGTLNQIKASKETREYAVIVRHKRDPSALEGELSVDSVVVQSPLIRPVLEKVFGGFPGVVANLERLEFSTPFVPFFHRWNEFTEERGKCDGETKVHVDILWNALQKEIENDLKVSSDLLANGVITFGHVWTLFTPGELVACSVNGRDLICVISRAEYYRDPNNKEVTGFTVTCRYIDVGRTGLGLAIIPLILPRFNGTTMISELQFDDIREQAKSTNTVLAMPAKMRPDFDQLKTRLIARGRKFEALKGYHFKKYNGDMEEKMHGRRKDLSILRKASTRIIIDAEAFENHMPAFQTSLLPLDANLTPQGAELLDHYPEPIEIDMFDRGMSTEERIQDRLKSKKYTSGGLTEEQLMICSPKVKGYALKTKSWAEFFIDEIEEIEFQRDAFTKIVLPENYKELISSFVTRHMSDNDGFDDLIAGKGRGLIILLSGEPGVGKTLTAESVAEEMQAPLYAFGAGELGSEAHNVERKLNDVLELCTRWKAVLLLDEADVFLEQRTSSDMERNKIVSVFLRVLEYYEGMMFMTTNRVSAFDAAFRSRIHLNMDYPPLNTIARKAIWSNFLRSPKLDTAITEDQIGTLALKPMNGREIKNAIKIASLLAGQKKEKLSMSHLGTVLAVNGFGGDIGYVLENDFRVL